MSSSSVGGVLDQIFAHISAMPNAQAVKKALFYRLEVELNSTRGIIQDSKPQSGNRA